MQHEAHESINNEEFRRGVSSDDVRRLLGGLTYERVRQLREAGVLVGLGRDHSLRGRMWRHDPASVAAEVERRQKAKADR